MEKKIRVVGTKFSYYNGFIMHYNIAIGISCFMADSCVCSILMPSISFEKKKTPEQVDYWTDGNDIICKTQEQANVIADLFEDMGADVMLTAEENDGWHVYACVFRLMEVHDGINPL